jgi:ribosomal-protein-alanine N-acetyltransferase
MTGMTVHIPTLRTERLRLRAARLSDFHAFAAFRADPERTRYVGGPCNGADAFDKLGELVGHWGLRGYGRFVIADRQSDEPYGTIGPYYPPDWPEPEIAWSVFAAAEGRAIAFEAATAARKYAYDTLGWSTAISLIANGNDRSVALAERLGCKREADFNHSDFGAMQVWRHPAPESLI